MREWNLASTAPLRFRKMCYISFDTLLEVGNTCKEQDRRKSRSSSSSVPDFSTKVSSETARQILESIRRSSLEGTKWAKLLMEHTRTVEPNLVGEVLKHLANEESAHAVFKWASKQVGYYHTLYTYNCLLGTLVRSGEPSAAYTTFKDMVKHGYTPDDFACTTVVRGFCKAGQPGKAYDVLKEMAAGGLQPSIESLNTIMQRLYEDKEYENVVSMVAEMKVWASPDVETYNILISAGSEEKRYIDLRGYYHEMVTTGVQPNSRTYELLVEAYCKEHKVENAAVMVKRMVAKGHQPSTETYKTLMFAYLDNWNPEAALKILRLLQKSGFEGDARVYQRLVDGLWMAGLIDRALSMIKEMAGKGFVASEISYSFIIRAKCISGKIDQSYDLYQELLKVGHFPNVKTSVRLIRRLSELDRAKEAFAVYEKMIEKNRPDQQTFHAMLSCLCRAGKILLASMLLREVLVNFKNFVPLTASFNCLLGCYCCVPLKKPSRSPSSSLGLEDEREIELENKTVVEVVNPDGEMEAETGSEAWRITDCLDSDKAMEVFEKMIENGRQPNETTFWILICGLCKANRQLDAYKLFRTIHEFRQVPSLFLYGPFVRELCKVDRFPEAEYVFDGLVRRKNEAELREMEARGKELSNMYADILAARFRVKKSRENLQPGGETDVYHGGGKKCKAEVHLSDVGVPWNDNTLGW